MNVSDLIQLIRYTFNNYCNLDQKIYSLQKRNGSNNFNLNTKFVKPFSLKRRNLPLVNKLPAVWSNG